jgi:ABC-type Fe3+/spermidine/putrescine transport system ATPase subunit
VLERGRVVQVGTADEVFLHPRTRFVAEFIGKTNLVEGVAEGPDAVAVGRGRLRPGAAGLTPASRRLRVGEPVGLRIDPAACVALAASEERA